ncbi:hypothetical protein DPMN_079296 [Dreissena polymorpha]|uniref:Uncharacterized protein n=1 Tax=Dreissena polymorpha TaxID=45954 RepID=A0A9D3YSV0_DREPO|nr:hypothetical protein DPMN_079296 [Dreissena polymorpha]
MNFDPRLIPGAINDISNISMISMANVNETANSTSMMTRLDNNAVTRLDDPTDNLDLTKTPADMFLDGCKVFCNCYPPS